MESEGSTECVQISSGKVKYKGKLFHREKILKGGRTYWRCLDHECYGRLTTTKDLEVVNEKKDHICPTTELDCLVEQCKQELKRYAFENPTVVPTKVIPAVMEKYSQEVKERVLQNPESMCRNIIRWRQMPGKPAPNLKAVEEKEAAMEKLKKRTLQAKRISAIDLVRETLKEMTPAGRSIMPPVDNLRRRVAKWARLAGVKLLRSELDEYVLGEGVEQQASSAIGERKLPESDNVSSSVRTEFPETETEQVRPNDIKQTTGMYFLRGPKTNGHCRIMIDGQIFHWVRECEEGNKSLYKCRQCRFGCPVTALVSHGKEYEVSGEHVHDYSKRIWKQRKEKSWMDGLKRVDVDSNAIPFLSQEKIHQVEFDMGNPDVPSPPTIANFNDNDTLEESPYTHETMEGDDFHMDFEPDPVIAEIPGPDAKVPKKSSCLPSKDTTKSGERCFVCGDELIVSETLSSSEEIFRKACCYLNIKSNSDWFPKEPGAFRMYSFCESCKKEITRIQDLYKKVEELQSVIFKKVERVEKRIADAEIVDNWMADAPSDIALRFEGFRKQVMINYRNKLRLRREIRVGQKMGLNLLEVRPVKSARIFASDPGEVYNNSHEDAMQNVEQAPEVERSPSPSKLRAVRKSSRLQNQQLNEVNNEPYEAPSPANNDMDDAQDNCSVASEKEVKFWHEDPSKLQVDQNRSVGLNVESSRTNEDFDASCEVKDTHSNDGDNNNDTDPDYSSEEDDDDEDWKNTRRCRAKKSTPESKMSRKRPVYKRNFPETIITKDNRVFMSGVEIIQLPPEACSQWPNKEAFSCGTCGKLEKTVWKIKQHICGHHLGTFKCKFCNRQFVDPQCVARHIKTRHSERTAVICEVCGRPLYGGSKTLKWHLWTHLSEEEKKDPQYNDYCPDREKDPGRPKKSQNYMSSSFQCSQCGKTFMRPHALRNHELTHSKKDTQVQCQYCGKMIATQNGLKQHVTKCDANKDRKFYSCPKCPLKFKTPATQSIHFKNHDKNQPFACTKCPRRFGSKSGIKSHKRMCTASLLIRND